MENSHNSNPDQKEAIDSVTIAAFDVDARIFRTLWHSLVKTPDVTLAGLKGDYTVYLSPIRVFVALFGLQFAVAAIFGVPLALDTHSFLSKLPSEEAATWLNGHDPIEIDRTLNDWLSLSLWPTTVLGSIPYLVLLKLYRPSLSWWGHTIVYLVTSNASFTIMVIFLPLFSLGEVAMIIGVLGGALVYLGIMGRLIARFYARTLTGAMVRMLGIFLLLPLTMLFSAIAQFFAADWILNSNFSLSFFELINMSSDSGDSP